jgi:uncharacterized membrane protein YphA (DoxX/SURF4 family)
MFPALLNYDFLATFVLRVVLGLVFVGFAYGKFFGDRPARIAFFEKLGMRPAVVFFSIIIGVELLAGIFLIVGAFTQIAAFVAGIIMTLAAGIKIKRPEMLPLNTFSFYFILAVVYFVMIFIGPGAFAFDLPL